MSVHKKLMQARISLQSVEMKKSGLNKFAGYDYFELSDFIPHVQRIFNEIGLCGVVSYEREIAKLTITDTDGGGEIIITSPMAGASLKGCHDIQNLGAVETYQRRYLWVTAMEILEHDAIDGGDTKKNVENKQDTNTSNTHIAEKKTLTPDMKAIWKNAKEAYVRDKNLNKVLERYNMSQEHQEKLMAECNNEKN